MLISVAPFPMYPREAVAVVAKAGGVTHQEAFRIFQVASGKYPGFHALISGKDPARVGLRILAAKVEKEIVDQVNTVAHPLIRNAAGKILIQPEFKVHPRVKRPVWLF